MNTAEITVWNNTTLIWVLPGPWEQHGASALLSTLFQPQAGRWRPWSLSLLLHRGKLLPLQQALLSSSRNGQSQRAASPHSHCVQDWEKCRTHTLGNTRPISSGLFSRPPCKNQPHKCSFPATQPSARHRVIVCPSKLEASLWCTDLSSLKKSSSTHPVQLLTLQHQHGCTTSLHVHLCLVYNQPEMQAILEIKKSLLLVMLYEAGKTQLYFQSTASANNAGNQKTDLMYFAIWVKMTWKISNEK